jgi:hypothetical protein
MLVLLLLLSLVARVTADANQDDLISWDLDVDPRTDVVNVMPAHTTAKIMFNPALRLRYTISFESDVQVELTVIRDDFRTTALYSRTELRPFARNHTIEFEGVGIVWVTIFSPLRPASITVTSTPVLDTCFNGREGDMEGQEPLAPNMLEFINGRHMACFSVCNSVGVRFDAFLTGGVYAIDIQRHFSTDRNVEVRVTHGFVYVIPGVLTPTVPRMVSNFEVPFLARTPYSFQVFVNISDAGAESEEVCVVLDESCPPEYVMESHNGILACALDYCDLLDELLYLAPSSRKTVQVCDHHTLRIPLMWNDPDRDDLLVELYGTGPHAIFEADVEIEQTSSTGDPRVSNAIRWSPGATVFFDDIPNLDDPYTLTFLRITPTNSTAPWGKLFVSIVSMEFPHEYAMQSEVACSPTGCYRQPPTLGLMTICEDMFIRGTPTSDMECATDGPPALALHAGRVVSTAPELSSYPYLQNTFDGTAVFRNYTSSAARDVRLDVVRAECAYALLEVMDESLTVIADRNITPADPPEIPGAVLFSAAAETTYVIKVTAMSEAGCAMKLQAADASIVHQYTTTGSALDLTIGEPAELEVNQATSVVWISTLIRGDISYFLQFTSCELVLNVTFYTMGGGVLAPLADTSARAASYLVSCNTLRSLAFPHLPATPGVEVYIRVTIQKESAPHVFHLIMAVRIQAQTPYLPLTQTPLAVVLPVQTKYLSTVVDIMDDRMSTVCVQKLYNSSATTITARLLTVTEYADGPDPTIPSLSEILSPLVNNDTFSGRLWCLQVTSNWRFVYRKQSREIVADSRVSLYITDNDITSNKVLVVTASAPGDASFQYGFPCVNTYPDASFLPAAAATVEPAAFDTTHTITICPGSSFLTEVDVSGEHIMIQTSQLGAMQQPLNFSMRNMATGAIVTAMLRPSPTPVLYLTNLTPGPHYFTVRNTGTDVTHVVIGLYPVCPEEQFGTPGACVEATQCEMGEYEVVTLTFTSDRVCAPVTSCLEGQYIQVAATYSSDIVCADYTPCNGGMFEAIAGGPAADRVCSVPRFCLPEDDLFEVQAPTQTSDRVCGLITPCQPSEYEQRAPTATSNRVCNPVSTCIDGPEAELRPPTPTSDRVCACQNEHHHDYKYQVMQLTIDEPHTHRTYCKGHTPMFNASVIAGTRYRLSIVLETAATVAAVVTKPVNSSNNDSAEDSAQFLAVFVGLSTTRLEGDIYPDLTGNITISVEATGVSSQITFDIALHARSFCIGGHGEAPDGSCVPCAPGYYAGNERHISCTQCGPGTYSTQGAVQCELCSLGKFSRYQAAECTSCSEGTYQDLRGARECHACPEGYTSREPYITCHSVVEDISSSSVSTAASITPSTTHGGSTTHSQSGHTSTTQHLSTTHTTTHNRFNVTTHTPTTTTTRAPETEASLDEDSSMSPGNVAAVVMGSIAAVLLLGAVTYAVIHQIVRKRSLYQRVSLDSPEKIVNL